MQFLSRVPTALAIVATSTLAGVGAYVATRPAPIPVTTPEIALDVREPAQPSIDDVAVAHETAPVSRPQQAPPDDHRIELAFTVTIDKRTHVVISTDDALVRTLPTKGAKLVEDNYVTGAIAKVAVPDALAHWAGKELVVGASCHARVEGFAHAARLSGDPGYTGADDDTWTTRGVFEHGQHVLLARLDRDCEGDLARDAGLAPMTTGVLITDHELAAEARAALFSSEHAKTTDQQWHDADAWGGPAEEDWRDAGNVTTRVFEHAETHERWVIVHARVGGGCGERAANVLGVYRRGANGVLVRAYAAVDSGIDLVSDLVDVDGDGRFELITSGWMGPDRALRSLDDVVHAELSTPFFGCPC